MRNRYNPWLRALGVLLATVPLGMALARSIPEPPTIVYGRVLRLAGGQAFAVEQGTLTWTLAAVGEATAPLSLAATLGPAGTNGI